RERSGIHRLRGSSLSGSPAGLLKQNVETPVHYDESCKGDVSGFPSSDVKPATFRANHKQPHRRFQ
ncbi:MAG: hypothetical protein P8Z31_05640, partial [Gammaproteobacteria bacterium]